MNPDTRAGSLTDWLQAGVTLMILVGLVDEQGYDNSKIQKVPRRLD
jgi:hypothetical protein